ncbi:MAG TPA: iron transporter [Gammaproteobacteria bacterium]|nr:iron transporter [Gammaproteobacteria bacterium]
MRLFATTLLIASGVLPLTASALEYPAGKPVTRHGMEIGAVYLQPVTMEPAGQMPPSKADVHLEADIHAVDNNPNGFAVGSWMPYLTVAYKLTKEGGETTHGVFDPMVASDGPHYGKNVAMQGPGKYHLEYTIYPPNSAPEGVDAPLFMRHTDDETGVAPWFKPFTVEYDFVYAGIGKKGGY